MLDGKMRKLIDPVLKRWGDVMAARGATANGTTLFGLALGLLAAAMLALGAPGWLALAPLLAGRLLDGLDGAVARATSKTDFGGYLDIACDFMFYGSIPLAFVLRDPAANGALGAILLASFYVNGATFLGYAILAQKHGLESRAQGEKSLYYSAGLIEGSETIAFFAAICIWPAAFIPLAGVFAALCLLTAFARILLAYRVFASSG